MRRDKVAVIGGVQTYTGKQPVKLKLLFCLMCGTGKFRTKKGLFISSSYDGSFSVFFYACASQFYDASFSYHKAYSNNFLILFINKFNLS